MRFLFILIEGEIGEVAFGSSADEIEDSVTAGVHSGREGRPRDGGLRRVCRGESGVTSLSAQFGERREFSRGDQRLDDLGVEAVQSDHDHFTNALDAQNVRPHGMKLRSRTEEPSGYAPP